MPAFVRILIKGIPACMLALGAADALAQSCMPSPGQGNVCTANDLEVSSVAFFGPDSCIDGELISGELEVVLGLSSTAARAAAERYDVGLFVGQLGEPSIDGAQCLFESLSPVEPPLDLTGGSGPFLDLDGDACGDASPDPATTVRFPVTDLLCRDADGDGRLDFSATLTWKNNRNDICTDPADRAYFFSDQSSKCRLEAEIGVPVSVLDPPEISVDKSAAPEEIAAPGGPVTFRVVVVNSATGPVRLTVLEDDVYGDLDGRGTCALPVLLRAGELYTCSFEETVTGEVGDTMRDVVTATAEDEAGNIATASDDAVVTLVASPPSAEVQVLKFAVPFSVDEPGAEVTYAVLVYNVGGETVTLQGLDDDLYGNLDGQGTCEAPQVLVSGRGFYGCGFRQPVNGQPGDVVVDVVTATASGPGGVIEDADDASVEIRDVPSRLRVIKRASPLILPEPGGMVTFEVRVRNVSAVDVVTLETLVDSVHGDLDGRGDCAVPQVLAPDQLYVCRFTAEVLGAPGEFEFDSVDAAGVDDDGMAVSAANGATVYIINRTPSISVRKTALESTVQGPTADVPYSVEVVNTSSVDTVTIESLVDDQFGDLTLIAGTDCATPFDLAPGESSACGFTGTVSDQGDGTHVNIVTVSGTGDDGEAVVGTDDAVVTIVDEAVPLTPAILVRKTATPGTLSEPGGVVLFRVRVDNTGAGGIQLESLVDDQFGDLDGTGTCDLPRMIAPRQFYACAFEETLSGFAGDVHVNVVSATATDGDGGVLSETAEATVTFEDVPASMIVTKTATPTRLPEPGGPVRFTVDVLNSSVADPITIESLVDDIHGDLDARGTCAVPQTLAPSERYVCEFEAEVRGPARYSETDTVTATALDASGGTLTAAGRARVLITARTLALSVDKRANPRALVAPGGEVTYTVTVTNDSPQDALTLERLVDDRFGDLDGAGDCAVPQPLAVGGSYRCAFTRTLESVDRDVHINRVEALAVAATRLDANAPPLDTDTVVASDSATVLLLPEADDASGVVDVPVGDRAWILGVLAALLGIAGLWAARYRRT